MSTHSLGFIMDSLWSRLSTDHDLRRMNPYAMPNPHEFLLSSGQAIIEFCAEQGAVLFSPLPKEGDREAWYRLVAAWVFHYRTHSIESRAFVADKLGINASNLTNFLNGKRPLTQRALLGIAQHLGIEPYDIRPELGAVKAARQHRSHCKQMLSVKRDLKGLQTDIEAMGLAGVAVDHLLSRVGRVFAQLNA